MLSTGRCRRLHGWEQMPQRYRRNSEKTASLVRFPFVENILLLWARRFKVIVAVEAAEYPE